MIEVRLGNIVTIALAGALGYALLAGLPKLWAVLQPARVVG